MDFPLPYLLATAVTAGVWILILALRLPILHGCLGLLLAVACFGPAFANWDIGPITASPDRLVFLLLIGLAGLKRLVTSQPKLTFDRSDLVLAALIALMGVSVLTHQPPPHTNPRTPPPSFMFVASYLCPALLYWIVRLRRTAANDLRLIHGFFVAFGVYLAFTAVCESHGLTALIYPRYILQTRLHYQGRAVGPLLSAPALGTWMTVASVSVLLLALQLKGIGRAALFGILPMFAYAEYLTATRSAWLGYIIAVPLAALLAARSAMRHVLFVGFTLVGLVGGLLVGERFLFPERQEGSELVAHSTYQRLALLQRSIAMFVQRPILGWGFGQFEYAATVHGGGSPLRIVLSESGEELASHNLFLRFLSELGLVGCALLVLFFGMWAVQTRDTLKTAAADSPQRSLAILFAAALCAYVCEAMFHDVTFIAQDNMLIFFLAGCLGLPRRESSDRKPVLLGGGHRFTLPGRLTPLTVGSPRFS